MWSNREGKEKCWQERAGCRSASIASHGNAEPAKPLSTQHSWPLSQQQSLRDGSHEVATAHMGSCWYSIDFFHVTATNQNLLSFQVLYPSSAINQFCARAAQKVWVSPSCSHSAMLGAKWRLLGWPGACWLEQWKQPVATQSPVWANKIPDSLIAVRTPDSYFEADFSTFVLQHSNFYVICRKSI